MNMFKGLSIIVFVFGVASACKKPYAASYNYTRLMNVSTTQKETFALADTPAAGAAAIKRGYAPTGTIASGGNGLGLAEGDSSQDSIKLGGRICVAASYGLPKLNKDGSFGEAPEEAVICGKIVLCSSLPDLQGNLPWQQNEKCMMADCLPKAKAGSDVLNGMEPPGSLSNQDKSQPCNMATGRPTAFSVTEYFQLANLSTLALDSKGKQGMKLSGDGNGNDNSKLYLDAAYSTRPKGSIGDARVKLSDEDIYDGPAMFVNYSNEQVLGLNEAGVEAAVQVGFAKGRPGPTILQFREGGSSPTPSIDGTTINNSDVYPTNGNAPSGFELGIVETARGSRFQLQGNAVSASLGASGTVQVFTE